MRLFIYLSSLFSLSRFEMVFEGEYYAIAAACHLFFKTKWMDSEQTKITKLKLKQLIF